MAGSPGNVETRYYVVVVSAGTKPRRLARTIASFSKVGRKRAWELLRNVPVVAIRGASRWTAEEVRQELERRGATVEVRARNVEVHEPEPRSPAPVSWGWVLFVVAITIVILVALVGLILVSSLGSRLDGICNPECL